MAEFPALPIFIDAWSLDCAHLSDAEDGRYFRLCRLMWAQPLCRIPNDDAWIARKLSRSVEDVQRDIRPLIAEYCQSDGNWITQKRLTKEWLYVQKRVKARSVSAKARWAKEKTDAHAMRERTASHDVRTAPTPTPTPTPQEEPSAKAEGRARKASNGRGSFIPECWLPSPEDRAYAEKLGLNADVVAEEFRGYWRERHDPKARRENWSLTWQRWCIKASGAVFRRPAGHGGGNRGGPKGVVAALRLLETTRTDRERDGS